MASRGLMIPSSWLPYIFNINAAIAIVPIAAGSWGLLNPESGIKALNFTPSTTSNEKKLSNGLLRMYAVRQMFIGISTLALWGTGNRRALGLASLGGCLVAVVDGLVAKQVSGEHVGGHWAGACFSLFFAGAFLEIL